MFEKASEIRAAQRAKMVERALNRGRKEALAEIRDRLQSPTIPKDPETGAIILTPEDVDSLLGEATDGD